ncbi:hypothetical protein ACA910_007678 [Epithemia clementina (nom. ined.)]
MESDAEEEDQQRGSLPPSDSFRACSNDSINELLAATIDDTDQCRPGELPRPPYAALLSPANGGNDALFETASCDSDDAFGEALTDILDPGWGFSQLEIGAEPLLTGTSVQSQRATESSPPSANNMDSFFENQGEAASTALRYSDGLGFDPGEWPESNLTAQRSHLATATPEVRHVHHAATQLIIEGQSDDHEKLSSPTPKKDFICSHSLPGPPPSAEGDPNNDRSPHPPAGDELARQGDKPLRYQKVEASSSSRGAKREAVSKSLNNFDQPVPRGEKDFSSGPSAVVPDVAPREKSRAPSRNLIPIAPEQSSINQTPTDILQGLPKWRERNVPPPGYCTRSKMLPIIEKQLPDVWYFYHNCNAHSLTTNEVDRVRKALRILLGDPDVITWNDSKVVDSFKQHYQERLKSYVETIMKESNLKDSLLKPAVVDPGASLNPDEIWNCFVTTTAMETSDEVIEFLVGPETEQTPHLSAEALSILRLGLEVLKPHEKQVSRLNDSQVISKFKKKHGRKFAAFLHDLVLKADCLVQPGQIIPLDLIQSFVGKKRGQKRKSPPATLSVAKDEKSREVQGPDSNHDEPVPEQRKDQTYEEKDFFIKQALTEDSHKPTHDQHERGEVSPPMPTTADCSSDSDARKVAYV